MSDGQSTQPRVHRTHGSKPGAVRMGRFRWRDLLMFEQLAAAEEGRKPRSVSKVLGRTVIVDLSLDDEPIPEARRIRT